MVVGARIHRTADAFFFFLTTCLIVFPLLTLILNEGRTLSAVKIFDYTSEYVYLFKQRNTVSRKRLSGK